VAESNKKKYIIRPVAESNKKKCLIRPKLLAESYRYLPTLGEANSELEAAMTIQDESQPPKKISRTTRWRKRTKELKGDAAQVKKPRKEYSCTKCHMPMSSDGHTQFKGKRFCSVSEGKSKEEWLADMRNAGQGGHPSN
jgi:hypothetical protein